MSWFKNRPLRAAAGCAVAAVLLAACGGGQSASSTSPPVYTTPPSYTASAAPTTSSAPATSVDETGLALSTDYGARATYAFSAKDDDGYTTQYNLTLGAPTKVTNAPDWVKQINDPDCKPDPGKDLVVPFAVKLTNTSPAGFSKVLNFTLYPATGIEMRELTAVMTYTNYRSPATSRCNASFGANQPGVITSTIGVDSDQAISPGGSMTARGFVTYSKFFEATPKDPNGAAAQKKLTTMFISLFSNTGTMDGTAKAAQVSTARVYQTQGYVVALDGKSDPCAQDLGYVTCK